MSFSDLMSSGRGPGMIGMLIALVVLAGFGCLFMLSVDDSGTGKSLAAIVRDDGTEIEMRKIDLETLRERAGEIPVRIETQGKFAVEEERNAEIAAAIAKNEEAIATAEEDLVELEEAYFDYKNQYRAYVRDKAEDSEYETLATKDGGEYFDVVVGKVTSVGFEIRHRDGLKRIPYELLPDDIQDYFQFDTEQKESALKREREMVRRHSKAVSASLARQEKADAIRKKQLAKEEASEAQIKIRKLESEILTVQEDIAILLAKTGADSSNQQVASTSRIKLNNTNRYLNQVRSKRKYIAELNEKIFELRKKVQ